MTLASKRQELEETLDVFVSTLPSITGSEAWRSQSTGPNPDLVAIHAMTDAACIFLHKFFTGHYDSMAERCLTAAHNISSAARLLKEDDYEYLDPAISVSGTVYLSALITNSLIGMLERARRTLYLHSL